MTQETNAQEPQSETVSTEPGSESAEPEGESKAIATRPKAALQAQGGGVLPILPRNIEEAQRYASGLIQANIVPDAFRYSEKDARELGDPLLAKQPNAPLVLMGVLKALELGVAPQTGLQWLLPLRGRFTIWGDLGIALAQGAGLVAKHTKREVGPSFDEELPLGQWPLDFGIEYRIWRVGQEEPYVGRFTVSDAKRAKLWMNTSKAPWIDYPKRMLFNRARAFALRDGFADALNGMELAEEAHDYLDEAPEKPVAPSIAALVDETETMEQTNES